MTVIIVAVAWSLLTFAGWVFLSPLEKSRRDALLPTAPLFGLVVCVVVLHGTTVVMSVRVGCGVVAAVLALIAAVAWRRDPRWWRPSVSALGALAATVGCALLPAVWVLGPSLAVGDSEVLQLSPNNDAFYYVTVADWLQDHPATDLPEIAGSPDGGGVPPSYASARAQLSLNLRIGQELTHAALATVMGVDVEDSWYPLTALWVLLLPAAGVAAARFFALQFPTGLILGTMTAVAAPVVVQLASQNSDSLMGTALVPLALGSVVTALEHDPLVPRAVAGLCLAALVGTYTEYLPLVAPALVVLVLMRRPSEIPAAVRSSMVLLLAAVVAAPLIWLRAVRSLLFLGSISSDSFPTSYAGAPMTLIVGRFLGAAGPGDATVSAWLVALLVAYALTGLVAAFVLGEHRTFLLVLVGTGLALSVYLVTVRDRPYSQQRAVQLLLPLVLVVAAIGWDRAWSVVRTRRLDNAAGRRRDRPATSVGARLLTAGALGGAAVFLVSNSLVAHSLHLPAVARDRHVGDEFDQAAQWVRSYDGPSGAQTSVVVGDFFSQLWISDRLRGSSGVSYPTLHPSYQGQSSYWDREPRRWLLTDSTALQRVGRDVVVASNDRFALLDLSRGRAVVAVPGDVFGQNSWFIYRSDQGPRAVDLVGVARRRLATDAPVAPKDLGRDVLSSTLAEGEQQVRVVLTGKVGRRVVLSDDAWVFSPSSIRFASGRPPAAAP